ncbi:MAG: molybdopterin-dependent oxidoreductase [Candidatus Schekmanbacteria bacterium]|nr:molybdopterin-dependent oxidoreductase [Candidatus Schekmanbacteria bacterium]
MIRHSTCCLCEALCGIVVHTDGRSVTAIKGDPDDPHSRGHICPKGVALQDLHEDPDRLRQPVMRSGTEWRTVSWDTALDESARRIEAIRNAHGPDAVALYAGNPLAHNYSALLFGPPLLAALATRNRYSATSSDQLPHMFAALQMFGNQFLLPVPDIDRTKFLVILGANPAASMGSLMTAGDPLKRLKAIRERGGTIVLVDPRRTQTADVASEHHFIRPGTDPFLLLAVLHVMFAEHEVSYGPWRSYSSELEQLEKVASRFSPERVAAATGMSAEVIRELARRFCRAESAAFYGRLGTCVQAFGGVNAWLLLAINILSGNLDRPGGMMFTRPAVDLPRLAGRGSLRGTFDRWRSRVSDLPEFGGELPVSALAEEIETPGNGRIRALITIAGNPVLSAPNGARLERVLPSLELMISMDPYINETTRHAHLVLPPVSPLERDDFGLVLSSVAVRNVVKYAPAVFPPGPDGREDWDIASDLAARLYARRRDPVAFAMRPALAALRRLGPRNALDLLLRSGYYGRGVLPFLRLFRAGTRAHGHPALSLRALVQAPHGIDLGPLEPCFPERLRALGNPTINLAPLVLLKDIGRVEAALVSASAPRGDTLLLIGRRDLRSNNSWMHNSPRLVRGKPRCTLLIHPSDATSRGIGDQDIVEVTSRTGTVSAPAALDPGIMPGVVSLPHGWGHHRSGARLSVAARTPGVSANDVTDEKHLDELTGTAGFNGTSVVVRRAQAPNESVAAELGQEVAQS